MPDVFDADGLEISTLSELTTDLEDDFKSIYGNDINIDADSPDGQIINIHAQSGIDIRELIQQVNAGFSFENAEGTILDQRVSILGITRSSGTFTYQDMSIEIDRAMGLVGLDSDALVIDKDLLPSNLYTVKDDEGNEFYLLSSVTFTGSGTFSLTFRAAEIGVVEVLPNTITTPVTIIAGIVSVNNPLAANSIGIDEETDFQLKNRARASISINSIGSADSLQAVLSNLDGVTIATVYENYTTSVDANGQIANSIWCIVEGGDPDDIGQAIYSKKGHGCNMVGSEEVEITQPDGRTFVSKYDIPTSQNIYIRFTLSGSYDSDYIKSSIVANVFWEIGLGASSDIIYEYLRSLLGSLNVVTAVELSDDGISWAETVSNGIIYNRFVNDITRITIT